MHKQTGIRHVIHSPQSWKVALVGKGIPAVNQLTRGFSSVDEDVLELVDLAPL